MDVAPSLDRAISTDPQAGLRVVVQADDAGRLGLLVRLLADVIPGWAQPPVGLVTVHDRLGLAMVLGLVLNTIAFR